MNHLAVRVARCSRSWKGVHRRGEGSRRLGIDRKGDRGALGLFVLGSGVDAERDGVHVELEAADRAVSEQRERAGHGTCAGAVSRGGLEVLAGGARGGGLA